MRIMGMMLAVLMIGGGLARAYEVEGNPDRKISFGFNYDRSNQHADYSFAGFEKPNFSKTIGDAFLLDARLPINPFLTFSVHGGVGNSTSDLFTSEKLSYSGYDFGVGLRLYIQ